MSQLAVRCETHGDTEQFSMVWINAELAAQGSAVGDPFNEIDGAVRVISAAVAALAAPTAQ